MKTTKTHQIISLPFKEEWKDIQGYEGRYQISNYGKVKSLAREVPREYRPHSVKERLMTITVDNNGREVVGLTKDSKTNNKYVHRLVAQAFIANPLNKPEVNHLDFIKTNNCVQNLEWVTEKENIQHSYDMRNKCAGLTNNSHLYIVSDEEIKEGDWVYDSSSLPQDAPIKRIRIIDDTHYTLYGDTSRNLKCHYKKIVATTDKSLSYDAKMYGKAIEGYKQQLPQLPESFIQAYIKAYNEGKPITEVDLEMELEESEETKKWFEDKLGKSLPDLEYIIKTRPDNTVIVHQSKMYSRDEVIELLKKFDNKISYETDIDGYYIENLKIPNIDQFIKDNL